MSQTTILEVRGKTAGLVVGTDASFRFFSSEPAFDALDGRHFPSFAEAQRAANFLARHGLFAPPFPEPHGLAIHRS